MPGKKIVKKPTAKPAAKSAAKPAAKSVTKPAVKSAAKPAVKSAAKPAVKSATKPAVKSTTKPAVKSTTKPAVKSATKPAAKPSTPKAKTSVKSTPVKSPTKPQSPLPPATVVTVSSPVVVASAAAQENPHQLSMPAPGTPAPDFRLPTSAEKTIGLADLAGKIVVLYFYPKDDTPGCTKEACGFRDIHKDLADAGVTVLGISPDGVASHAKFAAKYNLGFPLLADVDHKVAESYGAWTEKRLYGKKIMSIIRSTFVINRNGHIAKVWPKVTSTEDHADEVLLWVRQNLK